MNNYRDNKNNNEWKIMIPDIGYKMKKLIGKPIFTNNNTECHHDVLLENDNIIDIELFVNKNDERDKYKEYIPFSGIDHGTSFGVIDVHLSD